ncbi:MAG: hypothetical protein D6790_21060, partial [Caldilineae bacterium]
MKRIRRISTDQTNRHRMLALAGLLAAFGVRLYHLGGESLWYDETVSAFLARESLPALIAHTARDIHPPGYYLLLHLWQTWSQPSLAHGLEFLLAWPSLFFGVLLLPLIYALARRLVSRRVGLIALGLAVLHPYHVWYSQEVRMYTLGAFLGLLCLWAAIGYLQAEEGRPRLRALGLYALAAAAGLYTLYYFAFLLIPLNLYLLGLLLWRKERTSQWSRVWPWLAANLLALLLWSPWLPVAWRQAVSPPVPPWRDLPALWTVLQESLAALLVGQSPPGGQLLPAAGWTLIVLLSAYSGYTNPRRRRTLILLTVYIFAPLVLIYLVSVAITPLYHVRYFFLYAAPVPLLLALAADELRGRRVTLGLGLAALLLAQGGALYEFWTNPRYQADDHRAAVAELARDWRPGDAVLINAGWVYTALDIYWPRELPSPHSARPAQSLSWQTFRDYTNEGAPSPIRANPPNLRHPRSIVSEQPGVIMIRGGSVDGPPSLGWGLPESDFYAI